MNLRHVVITSVNRDDLPDGGAEIWSRTIAEVRARSPQMTIEVLTPDFQGDRAAIHVVFDASPDIFAHNVETVERLTPSVRSRSSWNVSVAVLKEAVAAGQRVKTGLMLGLGETESEIRSALVTMADTRISILTLGQYLRPSVKHLPVARWVHPDEFARWKAEGEALGIGHVESGPLVRSSYHAEEQAGMRQVGTHSR